MFKKILQSLSKSQAAKQPAAAPAPVTKAQPQALKPEAPKSEPLKQGVVLPKASKPAVPAAIAPVSRSVEEMCGITPKMPKDQIQAQLKLLYRRYNRSASSLDAKIREEADGMLDAIVRVREKHFGEI
ncbi:MAG: hypothetical protein V4599_14710 [Verrucomicrobiota bacterium]